MTKSKTTEIIFSGPVAYPSLVGEENSKGPVGISITSRSEVGGEYLSFLELTLLLRHCLEF